MRAEIIAVGSELVDGASLDTNSKWLSTELARAGIATTLQITVGDNLQEIVDVLRGASRRADLVVVTGGLGPTLDDLTRDAIAAMAEVPLESDAKSLEEIVARFERMGRTMTDRNRRQALVPAGGRPIPNPRGTAPGIWFDYSSPDEASVAPRRAGSKCRIVALPGVPSEMKPMFVEEVRPRLAMGERVIRQYRLNVFGLGESAVEERLGEVTARGRVPEVGITAHEATISLRIVARGESESVCEAQAESTRAAIRERLGDLVFSEGEERLQDVVIDMLRRRRETLAVVETGLSGGRLTEWITAIPGADEVFRGGLTAISLDIGLNPPEAMPAEKGEGGRPARMLAEAYRASFKATWGLAVVGLPDEEGRARQGIIAVVGSDCVATASYQSYGDAAIDRSRSAKTALDLLRRRLLRR